MATQKAPLMVVSIFVAFIACNVLFPSLGNTAVQVDTADFGEVAVGPSSTIPLHIANRG